MLADRRHDVLRDGERGKQGPALKQDAPAPLDAERLLFVGLVVILAEDVDSSCGGGFQADNRAHQHRLARARPADDAEDLAPPHAEVEIVMHDEIAELGAQALDVDHVIGRTIRPIVRMLMICGKGQKSISRKNMAKNASMTITRNRDWTTESVVRWPRDSELPSTCMP